MPQDFALAAAIAKLRKRRKTTKTGPTVGGAALQRQLAAHVGLLRHLAAYDGPALRDAAGYKIIFGGDGGDKGAWSAQQLPNASSSCDVDAAYDARSLRRGESGPADGAATRRALFSSREEGRMVMTGM